MSLQKRIALTLLSALTLGVVTGCASAGADDDESFDEAVDTADGMYDVGHMRG